jgi:hypothetical protein
MISEMGSLYYSFYFCMSEILNQKMLKGGEKPETTTKKPEIHILEKI